MNQDEITLLKELNGSQGILRLFLSTKSITICNKLVKLGYADKGKNDMKNGTVMYYITRNGEQFLENLI